LVAFMLSFFQCNLAIGLPGPVIYGYIEQYN
jgi:hypothetical protein